MPPTLQKQLNIEVHQRTVLVSSKVVQTVKGWDTQTICAKIDAGEIHWVWDVSAQFGKPDHLRDLRFWAAEFIEPGRVRHMTRAAVVAQLARLHPVWRGTELRTLLQLELPSIHRLREAGDLPGVIVGKTLRVEAGAVESFLDRRFVGGAL